MAGCFLSHHRRSLIWHFAAFAIDGLLGVVLGEFDSASSLIVSVEGDIEDLLDEGLLLLSFRRLVSDFFLSSIIFLCIFPTNLVGVGAGNKFMKDKSFSSGSLGLGVGVFSGLPALVR